MKNGSDLEWHLRFLESLTHEQRLAFLRGEVDQELFSQRLEGFTRLMHRLKDKEHLEKQNLSA